jgi:hypothetical protein
VENEPLVIALSADFQQYLVVSFRDAAHPATLCTMSGATFRFISSTEVGFTTNDTPNQPSAGTSVIARMRWSDQKPEAVAQAHGDVVDFAWSPDGSSVAYLTYANAPLGGVANQLWLKTGSAPPRALTPLIPVPGRGGSPEDQIVVRFSNDGKYLLMVDTAVDYGAPASPGHAHFQVRSIPDGTLVWSPPPGQTSGGSFSLISMAAWSHKTDRLYYRDPDGVHTWDPPKIAGTLSSTLSWYTPSVSPDDRYVAYAVNMRNQPHVEVRDLVTNDVRVIRGTRAAPFFVADNLLFVAEYAPVPPGPGGMTHNHTGRAFVIDLRTIVETPVAFLDRIDSWPR